MEPSPSDAKKAILLVISQIPRGRVASYGQVAQMAGLPGRARLVGSILSQLPEGSAIPWYRVINAAGRISFPEGSPSYQRQRAHLQGEGVELKGPRIKLQRFRWNP